MEGVTRFCFAASYAVALMLELLQLLRPRPAQRWLSTVFGAAGLFAQTLFLFVHWPNPALPSGSLLLLAWVVAVFYLYGSLHYRRSAWGVFVLPLVLGLVVLSDAFPDVTLSSHPFAGDHFWGLVHGILLFLAAVGMSVGFLASVMYLVQAHRLRAKVNPVSGLKLLSLERLETMNRRAVNLAFPLLTAGLMLGAYRMAQRDEPANWTAPKVIGTAGLWLAFGLLMYLRYGAHLPGRRLSALTIAAFVLLLATLSSAHPIVTGDGP
jgi:ABC-type transport system involved in cytochrome c biogenesis permease subunit